MTQLDFIKQIIEYKEEYPEYEIMFFTGYDNLPENEGNYYKHYIYKVSIEFYAEYSDKIFNDEDELVEEIGANLTDLYNENNMSVSESEIEEAIDKELATIVTQNVIAVYTTV